MSIMRYQPRNMIDELQKEFFGYNPWLKTGDQSLVDTSDWVPRVDIREEKDRFVVLADIPGVDPKQIHISMEGQLLTVKGERQSESEENKQSYTRIERSYGCFYRQFTLPDTAASDKISAVSKHGVLEITIPKEEKAKSRTIQVKVEG